MREENINDKKVHPNYMIGDATLKEVLENFNKRIIGLERSLDGKENEGVLREAGIYENVESGDYSCCAFSIPINRFKELQEKLEILEELTGFKANDYRWEETNERKLVKIKEQKSD